ncbi:MAG: ABC transporter substrate-binding protein [Cumulibacter sp.]
MKRAIRYLAPLSAVAMVLAGCGDAPNAEKEADTSGFESEIPLDENYDPEGHFDFAYTSYPASWDPAKSVNGADMLMFSPVYDRLLLEEQDGTISPMLAEEFTASEDNKTLTLKLKEGLTFSDGQPFNAEAVKFNLEHYTADDSRINGEVYQIDEIEIVDDYTVDLHLNGGIGSLVVGLASRAGVMVSPAAVKSGIIETEPVGVGPYQATDISAGNFVQYEKTPDYWDPDAQRVASMKIQYMADDQTRINALKSGDVDGAAINPDELDTADDAGLIPLVTQSPRFIYFMLNAGIEPFDDPEVRKAINMAIDREAISQGMYDGYCTPQIQPFPEGSPGYSEKVGDGLDIFPYDPEAAKKILEDKGVAEVNIATAAPNVTIYTKIAEVLQEQLTEIGINMEIHSLPPVPQVQEFAIDKVTETFSSIFTAINDPDAITARYLGPDALFNPGEVVYEDLIKYAAEGANSLDPEERKPAYEKYMDAWVETPPHLIPLCMIHLTNAYNDNVSGAVQMMNGYPDLRGIAVAKE